MTSRRREASAGTGQDIVWPGTVSAPGKAILFGEHAVVHGEPAVVLAIDLRMDVCRGSEGRGTRSISRNDRYLRAAGEEFGGRVPEVRVRSGIPRGCGLGSSASLSACLSWGMLVLSSGRLPERREVALRAFGIEWRAQKGHASPTDTSCVTAGGAVVVAPRALHAERLWEVRRGERVWHIHRIPDAPSLTIVIGDTGVPAPTGRMVAAVRRRCERDTRVRDAIAEIGNISLEGVTALKRDDPVRLGELMDSCQKRLAVIGVSTHDIERLLEAARRFSYGAKITGAGGGGCIIALTDEPERCGRHLREAGAKQVYIVRSDQKGVCMEG